MGWYFGWSDRRSLAEEVLRSWDHKDEKGNLTGGRTSVLAHQFAGNNLWAVFEQKLKAEDVPERFICLFLLRCYPVKGGSKGERDWGYKDISESMGPCEVNCPLKYLDMVPAVTGDPAKDGPAQWSLNWRERVRAYWQTRNEKAARKRAATNEARARREEERVRYEKAQAEERVRWANERAAHLNRYETLLRQGETFSPENRANWIHTYGAQAIEEIEARVKEKH